MPSFVIAEDVPTGHCRTLRKVRDTEHLDNKKYAEDVLGIDITQVLNAAVDVDAIYDE